MCLSKEIIITLGLLLFAMVMFFTEIIPVWTTSIIVLLVFIVTGVLAPRDALIYRFKCITIYGCFYNWRCNISRTGLAKN